jgi:hypothetical protein
MQDDGFISLVRVEANQAVVFDSAPESNCDCYDCVPGCDYDCQAD